MMQPEGARSTALGRLGATRRATRRQAATQAAAVAGAFGTALAACGTEGGGTPSGGAESQGPATVRLRLYTGSPARAQAYEAAFGEWKKENPRITLEPELTDSAGPHTQALLAQLASGTPP